MGYDPALAGAGPCCAIALRQKLSILARCRKRTPAIILRMMPLLSLSIVSQWRQSPLDRRRIYRGHAVSQPEHFPQPYQASVTQRRCANSAKIGSRHYDLEGASPAQKEVL
jgi:hypothetical protein